MVRERTWMRSPKERGEAENEKMERGHKSLDGNDAEKRAWN